MSPEDIYQTMTQHNHIRSYTQKKIIEIFRGRRKENQPVWNHPSIMASFVNSGFLW